MPTGKIDPWVGLGIGYEFIGYDAKQGAVDLWVMTDLANLVHIKR